MMASSIQPEEARLKLELFNEKSELLEASRFLVWLMKRPRQPDYAKIIAGDWLAYADLHPDDIAAFALNLRLLIQPKDRHSIYDIPSHYVTLRIAEAARLGNFEIARLRTYLAEDAMVQFAPEHAPRTTNDELFNVIFYGGIAHSNEQKVANFRRLTREGIISVFTFSAFTGTLLRYLNCIRKLAAMNAVILQHPLGPFGTAARPVPDCSR
jgi:hypothetical protein